MRKVSRTALVPYTCEKMFALVDDIEAYPEFLPWCHSARIISRDDQKTDATLAIGRRPAAMTFSTRNRSVPDRLIDMKLLDGPFRELTGRWQFQPINDEGCRVTLDVQFEFSNAALATMLGTVFEDSISSLVDAFSKRARTVYGRG